MNRRNFFRRGATVAAGAALGVSVQDVPPASDAEVPRALDVRKNEHCMDIEVRRNGVKVEHCVAYDLDEQWLVRYRIGPDGRIAFVKSDDDDVAYITELGGVSVHWAHRA